MNKIYYLCLAFICYISTITSASSPQRVRIDFETPTGFTRHLLLAFTQNSYATDGFDYGYDGLNIDNYPDDLNWMIEDNRYVIQGVGSFSETKSYPLGMFLTNSGEIKISLNALENFENPVNVYVYDILLNTFTLINSSNYIETFDSGNYINRFFITFTNDSTLLNINNSNALSLYDIDFKNTDIKYLKNNKLLYINTNNLNTIEQVLIYSLNGQKIMEENNLNDKIIKISLTNIKPQHLLVIAKSNYNHIKSKIILKSQ